MTFSRWLTLACGVGLGVSQSGCTTVYPLKNYVMAREAVESAREVESARYAPGLWYKAEEAYRRAKHEFEEQQYKESAQYFQTAQYFAERAENSARYQRQKNGEETQ